MSVPICLVFWSGQLQHPDPSNIHVAYPNLCLRGRHIRYFADLSIPSASISRTVFLLYPTVTFYSSNLSSLNCCSHPRKHNRIVFDCFYFTQAITLCSLVLFQQTPSTLGVFTHSAPVSTTVSNNPQYMNVAVPILKLFSSVTCYMTIITCLLHLVTTFWQTC